MGGKIFQTEDSSMDDRGKDCESYGKSVFISINDREGLLKVSLHIVGNSQPDPRGFLSLARVQVQAACFLQKKNEGKEVEISQCEKRKRKEKEKRKGTVNPS